MNVALPLPHGARSTRAELAPSPDEAARLRRLRALLALFSLYTVALLAVMTLSDGANIGCILVGIAGHALYATVRVVGSWREAAWLDHARAARRVRSLPA